MFISTTSEWPHHGLSWISPYHLWSGDLIGIAEIGHGGGDRPLHNVDVLARKLVRWYVQWLWLDLGVDNGLAALLDSILAICFMPTCVHSILLVVAVKSTVKPTFLIELVPLLFWRCHCIGMRVSLLHHKAIIAIWRLILSWAHLNGHLVSLMVQWLSLSISTGQALCLVQNARHVSIVLNSWRVDLSVFNVGMTPLTLGRVLVLLIIVRYFCSHYSSSVLDSATAWRLLRAHRLRLAKIGRASCRERV